MEEPRLEPSHHAVPQPLSGYRTVPVRTFVVAAALTIVTKGNSAHTSSPYGLRVPQALCCLSAPREAVYSWVRLSVLSTKVQDSPLRADWPLMVTRVLLGDGERTG